MLALQCLRMCCCPHLFIYVHAFTGDCACALIVMKGFEFASGGEFIIILILQERYSLACPSHAHPSTLRPADKMSCVKTLCNMTSLHGLWQRWVFPPLIASMHYLDPSWLYTFSAAHGSVPLN